MWSEACRDRILSLLLKSSSYVLAGIERGQIAEVVRSLKSLPQVEEGALLIGRFDLLIRIGHYDRSDLYRYVSQIRAMPGIRTTSTHIPFEGFTKDHMVEENDALAISLLRTESAPAEILAQLKNLRYVAEAYIIPGDWDLLAILHSKNVEQILETAVNQFEGVQGISKTETLLARQYFKRISGTTSSVGTYIPQFAFEKLKDSILVGTQERIR